MGCFGSASSKQADSNSSEDSKSQKRRSDEITKQLQKDKQVSRGPPERKVHCESIHDSEGTFQNVKFRSFRRCNNRTNKLSMPLNKITKQIPPFLSIRY